VFSGLDRAQAAYSPTTKVSLLPCEARPTRFGVDACDLGRARHGGLCGYGFPAAALPGAHDCLLDVGDGEGLGEAGFSLLAADDAAEEVVHLLHVPLQRAARAVDFE
jgi:hypothetical protein